MISCLILVFTSFFIQTTTQPLYFERLVNNITIGDQESPKLARLTTSAFVITWENKVNSSTNSEIRYRCFFANGSYLSQEIQANQETSYNYERPVITALIDGFMIAWQFIYGTDRNSGWFVYQVNARSFDNIGNNKTVQEFYVAGGNDPVSGLKNTAHDPWIFGLLDGGVVVTYEWNSDYDLTDLEALGTIFDEYNGLFKQVSLSQINDNYPVYCRANLQVVASAFDGFVGLFTINTSQWYIGVKHGNAPNNLYFNLFNNDGTPVFSQEKPVPVNEPYDPNMMPSMANLTDGGFVITWNSETGGQTEFEVFLRRFDKYGNPTNPAATNDVSVTLNQTGNQTSSGVAGLINGGYVVVWQSYGQDGDGWGIFAKIFDVNDTAGQVFQVNTNTTNNQMNPTVGGLINGDFVIAWQSEQQDGSGWGVYTKRFAENGTELMFEDGVIQCFANLSCLNGQFCNRQQGLCLQCVTNQECQSLYSPKDFCNTETGVCYQCVSQANCPDQRETCDPGAHACYDCYTDADCMASFAPQNCCNLTSHLCQSCLFDSNCTDGQTCFKGSCVQCVSDTNCTQNFSPTTKCNQETHHCLNCMDNTQCPNGETCTSQMYCVQCISDANCSQYNPLLKCNLTAHTCQQCLTDSDCPNHESCDQSTRSCVQCVADPNCTNYFQDQQYCDTKTNQCKTCVDNSNCPNNLQCSEGECYQCVGNSISCEQYFSPRIHCDISSSTCVQCMTDFPCEDSYESCNSEGTCVPNDPSWSAPSQNKFIASSLIVMAFVQSNPTLFWNAIRIFQAVFYFLFFNIQLPQNLINFISIFTLGRFDLFISFSQIFHLNIKTITLPSPLNFYHYNYTGYLFNTCGPVITMFFIYFAAWCGLKIINTVTFGTSKRVKKVLKKFEYPLIIGLWASTVSEFMYGSFLQLLQARFDISAFAVSTTLAILLILYAIAFPIACFKIIKDGDPTAHGYVTLTEEYHQENIWSKYGFIITYIKRATLPLALTLFYYRPFHQIAAAWSINVLYLFFLIRSQPKTEFKDTVTDIIQEACFLINHFMMSLMLNPDLNSDTKSNLGIAIIIFFGIILGSFVINMLISLFYVIKKFWNKGRFNNRKITREALNERKKIFKPSYLKLQTQIQLSTPKIIFLIFLLRSLFTLIYQLLIYKNIIQYQPLARFLIMLHF